MSNPNEFRLPDTRRWTAGAACVGSEHLMFPTDKDEPGTAAAKALCDSCPVRQQCLNEALDNNESAGIWGGLDPDERRSLKRRTARRTASEPESKHVVRVGVYTSDPYRRPFFG